MIQASQYGLTGPELDAIVQQAREWYLEAREFLISQLESGPYPYGHVKLTPAEQLSNYMAMTPQDWENLRQQRLNRYRGDPAAYYKANRDLSQYRDHMERIKQRLGMSPITGAYNAGEVGGLNPEQYFEGLGAL